MCAVTIEDRQREYTSDVNQSLIRKKCKHTQLRYIPINSD